MLSYIFIREILIDMMIKETLLNHQSDSISIAMSLIALPIMIVLSIITIAIDIILIPFYILIGLVYLIVRLIRGE